MTRKRILTALAAIVMAFTMQTFAIASAQGTVGDVCTPELIDDYTLQWNCLSGAVYPPHTDYDHAHSDEWPVEIVKKPRRNPRR